MKNPYPAAIVERLSQPPEADHPDNTDRMPRREFVTRLAMGVAGFVIGAGLSKVGQETTEATQEPERIQALIEEGLTSKWTQAVVFPGMIIAAPGTMFYDTPTLEEGSETDLGIAGDNRIGVLRPFFAGASLNMGLANYDINDRVAIENTPIKAGTLAFWRPGPGKLAYFNYAQSIETVQPIARTFIGYEAEDGLGLTAQHTTIDGRKVLGGTVVYPYIDNSQEFKHYDEEDYDPVTDMLMPDAEPELTIEHAYKVLGHSLTYMTVPQVSYAISEFSSRPRSEPIQLPE